ncbi:hypothetical protein RI129_002128 [Pyrocoelia pectoralis]|uniref:Uncharacterized protein n=1 Tax=Pyrocoelia pectoralis TaxID=417401 RepID=A0AAN7VLB6_9COLE
MLNNSGSSSANRSTQFRPYRLNHKSKKILDLINILGRSYSEESIAYEDLFIKNTDSFKCLAQVSVSRSSILRHPLYPFPIIQNPGLERAIDYKEPEPVFDGTGCENYLRLCKFHNVPVLRRVLKSLGTNELNLKYFGLKEKQVLGIMDTLKQNKYVEYVDLQDNWLSANSVKYVSEMLKFNFTIKKLALQECRIKPEGAEILSGGLINSPSLVELDLSFNSLGDEGMTLLEMGLRENLTIKILNLSHNELGEDSGMVLSRIFLKQNILKELDLSWNNFNTYSKGNMALFKALSNCTELRAFNLAWNTISDTSLARSITTYLRTAKNLECFDISNNRLIRESLHNMINGLKRCKELRVLKIGNNLIEPDQTLNFLTLFNYLPMLTELSLENISVNKDFLPIWMELKEQGKKIEIGTVLNNYVIHGPDKKRLLFNRAKYLAMKAKSKKSQVDFGHFILQLPENDIEPTEFEKLITNFKMKKVDVNLITAIMNEFPAPKNMVSCKTMKESYMAYFPNTDTKYKNKTPVQLAPPPREN